MQRHCAVETARTGLIDLEDSTDEEIEKLRREFQSLHRAGSDAQRQKNGAVPSGTAPRVG
jgi:hypothetical protein